MLTATMKTALAVLTGIKALATPGVLVAAAEVATAAITASAVPMILMVRMLMETEELLPLPAPPVSLLMPIALMTVTASPRRQERNSAENFATVAGKSGDSQRTSLWPWSRGAALLGGLGGGCFAGCASSP